MIDSSVNLLAIIIILIALAAAGAVIYIAWELSSDKPPAGKGGGRAKRTTRPDQDHESGP